jgi:hypothetical protein
MFLDYFPSKQSLNFCMNNRHYPKLSDQDTWQSLLWFTYFSKFWTYCRASGYGLNSSQFQWTLTEFLVSPLSRYSHSMHSSADVNIYTQILPAGQKVTKINKIEVVQCTQILPAD